MRKWFDPTTYTPFITSPPLAGPKKNTQTVHTHPFINNNKKIPINCQDKDKDQPHLDPSSAPPSTSSPLVPKGWQCLALPGIFVGAWPQRLKKIQPPNRSAQPPGDGRWGVFPISMWFSKHPCPNPVGSREPKT